MAGALTYAAPRQSGSGKRFKAGFGGLCGLCESGVLSGEGGHWVLQSGQGSVGDADSVGK